MNPERSRTDCQLPAAEEAEAYDLWFRDQVREAIADTRPSIPHDQVMKEMRELLASRLEKISKNS
jgi:hypothetical protein